LISAPPLTVSEATLAAALCSSIVPSLVRPLAAVRSVAGRKPTSKYVDELPVPVPPEPPGT
jgi:hypothetical protein